MHRPILRYLVFSFLIAPLLLATTDAVAESNYWSGLSPRQKEILNSGETLILEEDVPRNPWPRFIVYQLVKATPAQVAAVFWDLQLDPKYVPSCLSVTIISKPSPHVIDGEYTLKMPFFLPDEVYVSRNNLHRRTPEDYEISWIVLRSRYTKSCSGTLSLQKHEKGTLLRYSNLVEPGSRIAGIMKNNAGHQVVASVKALASQVARELEGSTDLMEKQMNALNEAMGSPSTR
ncbi:MAG: SRPBCC family protein [Chthoniobacterales bacterium]